MDNGSPSLLRREPPGEPATRMLPAPEHMQPTSERTLPAPEAIVAEARRLGFGSAGIAGVDLAAAEPGLQAWLDAGWHGDMAYMARHGLKRARPAELVPGTLSAIMVTLDYAPDDPAWIESAWQTLAVSERAYVSRYALGRDYHKIVRARLQRLADWLEQQIGPHGHRVFCDSAPVLEVELATRAGLGWRGKHTLMLSRERGSMFFIGTLYTSLPLVEGVVEGVAEGVVEGTTLAPAAAAPGEHCGRCRRCLDICPTGAIVAPYRLDARRCISYLTIEYDGVIEPTLAEAIGNRVYGCDDCQLVCPWNRFARPSAIDDFGPRQRLDVAGLVELFAWSAEDFSRRLEGSAIRRIGLRRRQRNLAVAMGNALRAGADPDGRIAAALQAWLAGPPPRDAVVEAQVRQALDQGDNPGSGATNAGPGSSSVSIG